MNWLHDQNMEATEYWISGFSFGAWIALQSVMRRPEIENYILSVIEKYFPNIQGVIQIQSTPDRNTILITITYSIVNTGINDTAQINLTNG